MWRPTPDELLNTITHAIGFFLAVAGSIVMLVCVTGQSYWQSAGCGVYALALVGVYACSTISHSASDPEMKRRFRMLDQGFIYLLIVGTYTPFGLAYLRSPTWLAFLAVLWLLALFGFVSKTMLAHRVDAVAVWIYLILGWLPVFAAFPLAGLMAPVHLWWMLAGGLCYSLGTWFLVNDYRKPHFHAIWHIFVIAGSAFHFFAILRSVATVTL